MICNSVDHNVAGFFVEHTAVEKAMVQKVLSIFTVNRIALIIRLNLEF